MKNLFFFGLAPSAMLEYAALNPSPNTGDTPWEIIVFAVLGAAALIMFVFFSKRRKK